MLAGFAPRPASANAQLSPAAKELMLAYQWPGNVRELRNELQRITVLWPSTVIEPAAFSPAHPRPGGRGPDARRRLLLEAIENEHIRKILSRTDTFEEAARILGIEPSTLWRKRQRMGL
jgi:NtrC-family two-component system response regulator AlgB